MFSRRRKILYLFLYRKLKNFWLNAKSREFLNFLFFLFLAAIIWLIQTLNGTYDTEIKIPLQVLNVPKNVIMTYNPVDELSVKIKDKGTVLFRYALDGDNFKPITIDFNRYKSNINHTVLSHSMLQRRVREQLMKSTQLISIKPDTIDYIYSIGECKKVPVAFYGTVEPKKEYFITDTIFTPDSVLVYAPEKILEGIKSLPIEPIYAKDAIDTLRYTPKFKKIKGAKYYPTNATLIFPVDVYVEKVVRVPIRGVEFPEGKFLRTFPSAVDVVFKLGSNRFKEVDASDFSFDVNYNDLLNSSSEVLQLQLTSRPDDVSIIRILPEQVDVLIEQEDSI